MSDDKTKITLRISNSVYEHYKDQKNYQAKINNLLLNEINKDSKDYGYSLIAHDSYLENLSNEYYKLLQKIREELNQEIPFGVKDNDGLANIFKKLSTADQLNNENMDALETLRVHRETLKKEITKLYSKLIDEVAGRLTELVPRKINYVNMYFDEILTGKEHCVCLIISVIQLMERYFIGDLYYKDISFNLKSLSEDDYAIAVIRFYTLIIHVLDTVEDSDVWDNYIQIIEEQHINKKKILEFVFYPIFEMEEKEALAEAEADAKIPEFKNGQISLYNLHILDTFEAQILISFLLSNYINDSIVCLELQNMKFRGVDMTAGIKELKQFSFIQIKDTKDKLTLILNPTAYDEFWIDHDFEDFTINGLKSTVAEHNKLLGS